MDHYEHVHENQWAVGHLEKVKRMVEEGYDCSEVLMRHCMVAAGDMEAAKLSTSS